MTGICSIDKNTTLKFDEDDDLKLSNVCISGFSIPPLSLGYHGPITQEVVEYLISFGTPDVATTTK